MFQVSDPVLVMLTDAATVAPAFMEAGVESEFQLTP
jgi:hypothetical protein